MNINCSCKFIIHIDMLHLGVDWDNMAYDKLVIQLKVIMGYMHQFHRIIE